MLKKATVHSKGFSLIELVVTGTVAAIAIISVGVALVDSQRGWRRTYNRAHSNVVIGGYVARRIFDSTVRKASMKNILLDETGSWVEVRYYQSLASAELDRYARFYLSDDVLNVEYGSWNPGDKSPKVALGTHTVCSNVSSCIFTRKGASVQMVLKLDNGSETATVVSSAVTHN